MRVLLSRALAVAITLCGGCATSSRSVVKLPRPNSGTFTFAEAEARKAEIFSAAPSGIQAVWKNPYLGFSVHITRDDEVIVHQHTLGFFRFPSGKMSVAELEELLAYYPSLGNPLGVLVTCERDARLSPVFARVVEVLFKPRVQIFYCKRA